jgi:hypothetical protein
MVPHAQVALEPDQFDGTPHQWGYGRAQQLDAQAS